MQVVHLHSRIIKTLKPRASACWACETLLTFIVRVMEAIAGLSLAANILQVVDFSAKLLSKGREIQQAGSTIQKSELEAVTTDFAALSGTLKSWARPDPAKLGPLARENQVQTS